MGVLTCIDSSISVIIGLFDIPPLIFVYCHDVLYYFHVSVKISILLSISNDAPVRFLQILPSISHETTVSSIQLFNGVFQFKIH